MVVVVVVVVGVVECSWLTPIIEVKRIIHSDKNKKYSQKLYKK